MWDGSIVPAHAAVDLAHEACEQGARPSPSQFTVEQTRLAPGHTTAEVAGGPVPVTCTSTHRPGGGAAQSGACSLIPSSPSEALFTPNSRGTEEEPQAYEGVSSIADRIKAGTGTHLRKVRVPPWNLPAAPRFPLRRGTAERVGSF